MANRGNFHGRRRDGRFSHVSANGGHGRHGWLRQSVLDLGGWFADSSPARVSRRPWRQPGRSKILLGLPHGVVDAPAIVPAHTLRLDRTGARLHFHGL